MLGRAMPAVMLVMGVGVGVAASPAGAAANLSAGTPMPAVATDLPCTPPTYPSTFLSASVRLDHDVTCPVGTEWNVGPGTTVDLNGHTVTVDVDPRFHCTRSAGDPFCTFNVQGGTLRNGKLVGADVFVNDYSTSHGLATQLTLTRDASLSLNGGLATNNVLVGGGVEITGGGAISHSWLVESYIDMVNSIRGLSFTVTDNIIVNSPGTGVGLYSYFCCPNDTQGRIERNLIIGSTRDGIAITGALDDLGPVSISHNIVAGSGGNGIELSGGARDFPGGPVTIGGNLALFNNGHGIDAPWVPGEPSQVIDAGRNTALFNQTRPQCVGVHC